MKAKDDRAETKWKLHRYTDFYFECMALGHDVRIFLTGGQCWYAYCVECDKVWKLTFGDGARLLSVSADGLPPGTKAYCDKLKAKIVLVGVK